MAKKVSDLKEYTNFSDVFFKEFASILPKRLDINEYAIDLEPDKQPSYKPIYNLVLVELETLRPYVKTNLANKFI